MLSFIRHQSRILLKGVDTLSKYYSIHEFSKIIGVSAQTLRNWDANGKLHPHHTTVSGYRYYSDEQLNQVINVKPKKRITIGYCRVSSHKQKDDLERQIDNVKTYLLAKGQPFEIISDIGSGIDYKKKGLQELIRRISQNQVEKVVVLYKDRLLRFGFELINISLHFIIVRLRLLIILKNLNSRNLLKIWFR